MSNLVDNGCPDYNYLGVFIDGEEADAVYSTLSFESMFPTFMKMLNGELKPEPGIHFYTIKLPEGLDSDIVTMYFRGLLFSDNWTADGSRTVVYTMPHVLGGWNGTVHQD